MRIPIIEEGSVRPKKAVREDYERLRPLERLNVQKRGCTLDVLQVVQSLGAGRAEATPLHKTFTLAEVYAQADGLARLHPGNRHIPAGEILRLAALAQDDYPCRIVRFGNSCKCCGILGLWNFWVVVRTDWHETEIRNAKIEIREGKGKVETRNTKLETRKQERRALRGSG